MSSPKTEIRPSLDLDVGATDEIALDDDIVQAITTGVSPTGSQGGLSARSMSPIAMKRTPSSSSAASGSDRLSPSTSSAASKVRAAAAMWETKPSASLAPRPVTGRKRSGTTVNRPNVAAAASKFGGSTATNGARPLSPPSSSPRLGSSPGKSSTLSSLDKSPGKSEKPGLKPLRLGGSSRATPSAEPPVTVAAVEPPSPGPEPQPAAVDASDGPTLSVSRSPFGGSEKATSLAPSPRSVISDLSEYESVDGGTPPLDAPEPLESTLAHDNSASALGLHVDKKQPPLASASEHDLFVRSPVDYDTTERQETREHTPEPSGKPALPASVPLMPVSLDSPPLDAHDQQTIDSSRTESLKLETIDLDGQPPRTTSLNTSTSTLRPSTSHAKPAGSAPAASEPETIVTPASPVHGMPALQDLNREPTGDEELSRSPISPAESAPRSAGSHLSDVPLTPAKLPSSSPVTPAPTRMASLFTRVLDYGKQTTQTPEAKPIAKESDTPPTPDEKKLPVLPEMPRKSSSTSSGKGGFFTSASSFSFNLPSLPLAPLRTAGTADASPPQETTPTMGGNASLAEPKAATTWRSTMSNFLQSRGSAASAGSGASAASTPLPSQPSNGSSSVNLLLHRLDSPTSVRDRRISREYGGGERLREGFDRVRNEMEGAARDIRREIANGDEHPEEDSIDWAFWGSVVQNYEDVARQSPKDLSKAIQQGIPPVIRGPIWQLMSSSKSAELEETFKALLKLTSPYEKAIQKDISRTFPNHKFFKNTGAGQDGLYMVVKAYSLYDREVGYTQGLAFIVAVLLLNMPDEEAFCVLVRLMDSYGLRSHYLADMPGLQLRLYQFDRLLEDVLPLLHSHFVRKGIKSSMYASQWLMTLFSYRLPIALVYRVFDIVLAEGIEAIFRFALALLAKSEEELIKLEFEPILAMLSGDLFEAYRTPETERGDNESIGEGEWLSNDFVRDAYKIHITPLMLDHYQAEWEEKCRAQTEHMRELDQLRNANRHLSSQVKTLESSLAAINQEHVELVRQLVMAKIAKEDMENELVKYKAMCARLSQQQLDEDSSSGVHAGLALSRSTSGSPASGFRSASGRASGASSPVK